ncbi:MAG: FeoB-associated Cys-rich membrane protein [Microscillaceae bacterium]|jgi:flagellar biogenesis protein FliO|nr:FeoB-associated Cys-rich membrane protein [Microscillaceae bacterium]
MQELLVVIIFIGAVIYLINRFRQDFRAKSAGCAKGCGTCQATDLSKKIGDLPKV